MRYNENRLKDSYFSTHKSILSLSSFHSLLCKKFLISFLIFTSLDNPLHKTVGTLRRGINLPLFPDDVVAEIWNKTS